MFIINISLKTEKVPVEKADSMFDQHRKWFAKYFEKGSFLILGPYKDKDNSGVILAQAENRKELDDILSEDVYYPLDLATYEINEFKAVMVAENISK